MKTQSSRRLFTLIELVAAGAILLVLLGIGAGSFHALKLDDSPRSVLEKLQRVGALCRRQAVAQGIPVAVFYSVERRVFWCGAEKVNLPESVALRHPENEAGEMEILRFFPDGSALEQKIELTDSRNTARLLASPLTGLLYLEEEE